MQSLIKQIKATAAIAINHLYTTQVTEDDIQVNETKPDFSGDYTVVLFPFVKLLCQNPAVLGKDIGDYLVHHNSDLFSAYDVVAGFLNLTVTDKYLALFLGHTYKDPLLGMQQNSPKKVMIEYSSPNTNKPLHFGHLRNIFLGWSVSEILKTNGHEVVKANLVNDRGIHICKSMIAWMRYGNNTSPESAGIKGDHLVGDYYVRFNDQYKQEVEALIGEGYDKERAEKEASIMKEAQDLLRKWEQGDPETINLWKKMNGWVYKGFEVTYKNLGVDFDKMYYESDTYLLGKELVEEGLQKAALFRKEDGSVWIDLTADGLDEKLLLRSDGTSVYMTQDLGTAKLKFNDFQMDQSVYVIADEQNYHMQVLKLILQKLQEPCADGIYHLSYGMVELPTGRMKSREGTVVDADDMLAEMIRLAQEQTEEKTTKIQEFSSEEKEQLYRMIGLGALKFYLLRVEPKKKMVFDPKESIDLHGFTATFIQYAHARICSILRNHELAYGQFVVGERLTPMEKSLILLMEQFPGVLENAAKDYSPAVICNYAFRLAQTFNSFYDKHSISKAESEEKKQLRLMIITMTATILKRAMATLGIEVPEKM